MSGQEDYPQIVMSGTDPNLPQFFPTGYDKYSQIKPMASGGRGELFSAWDNLLGRQVAVKTLKPELAADDAERRRFLREARVTAQLAHPNTVPVYEVGRADDGSLYFTMKRLLGEDLFAVVKRLQERHYPTQRVYPLPRLVEVVVQACQALVYAHSHGVVHRDLKPENIWIGRFDEVLVLDWGVAKVWGQPDEPRAPTEFVLDRGSEPDDQGEGDEPEQEQAPAQEQGRAGQGGEKSSAPHSESGATDAASSGSRLSTLTRSGSRPGTPLYMSPEQVAGHRYVDERTDVYSMGVVLYELLTLKLPFRGGSVESTFEKIMHDEPIPPTKRSASRKIPTGLDEIVLKAMMKEPRSRYASVREFVEAIRPFAQ